MKYYKLIKDYNDISANFLEAKINDNNLRFIYLDGEPPQKWKKSKFLHQLKNPSIEGLRDVQRNSWDLFITSNRLKQFYENSKLKGGSFYQVSIEGFNDQDSELLPMYYCHIEYSRKGTLDIQNSKAGNIKKIGEEEVYMFTIPAFRKTRVNGLDIFRIQEKQQGVYVSERFKNMFEDNGFTGAEFMEVRVV